MMQSYSSFDGRGHHAAFFAGSDSPFPVPEPAEGSGLEITADNELDLVDRVPDESFAVRKMQVAREDGSSSADDETVSFLGTGDVTVLKPVFHPCLFQVFDAKGALSNSATFRGSNDIDITIPEFKGVISVNKLDKQVRIVGGKGITVQVDQEGRKITITADAEKEEEDEDPTVADPCEHPGNGTAGGGGGGGGADAPAGSQSDDGGGGGCGTGCEDESTTGGSGSGSPEPGASGKPAEGAPGGGESAPGKEVPDPPSSGSSGTEPGAPGKEIPGGSPVPSSDNPPKTPVYDGSHKGISGDRKSPDSPFHPPSEGGVVIR